GTNFTVEVTVQPRPDYDFTTTTNPDYTNVVADRAIVLTEAICGGQETGTDDDFAEYVKPTDLNLATLQMGADGKNVEFEIVSINLFLDSAGTSAYGGTDFDIDNMDDGSGGNPYEATDQFVHPMNGPAPTFGEFYRNQHNAPIYVHYVMQPQLGDPDMCDDTPTFTIIIKVEPVVDVDFDLTGITDWTVTDRQIISDITVCGAEDEDNDGVHDEYGASPAFTLNGIGIGNTGSATVTGDHLIEFNVTAIDLFDGTGAGRATLPTTVTNLFDRSSTADGTGTAYAVNDELADGASFQEYYENHSGEVVYVTYTLQATLEPTGTADECTYLTFEIIVAVQPAPEVDFDNPSTGYTADGTARTFTSDSLCGSTDMAAITYNMIQNEHTPMLPLTLSAEAVANDLTLNSDFTNSFEILGITVNDQADNMGVDLSGSFSRDDATDGTGGDPLATGDRVADGGTLGGDFYRNTSDSVAYVIYTLQPQLIDGTDVECTYDTFNVVVPVQPIPDVESMDGTTVDILDADGMDYISQPDVQWNSATRNLQFAAECGSGDGESPYNFTLDIKPFEVPLPTTTIEYELVNVDVPATFEPFVFRFNSPGDFDFTTGIIQANALPESGPGSNVGNEYPVGNGTSPDRATFTEYLFNFSPTPATITYSFRPQIDDAADGDECYGDVFTVTVVVNPIGQTTATVDDPEKCVGDEFELEGEPVATFFNPSPFTHEWTIDTFIPATGPPAVPPYTGVGTYVDPSNGSASGLTSTLQEPHFIGLIPGVVTVRYQGTDATTVGVR
ncbi:MAG: hypothetical protein AAFN92_10065, partial [Bacteroidota bacterium]